jgi:hypothetical protein
VLNAVGANKYCVPLLADKESLNYEKESFNRVWFCGSAAWLQ